MGKLLTIIAFSTLSLSTVAMAERHSSNVECEAKKEALAANVAPQKSQRIVSALLDSSSRRSSETSHSGTATR